LQDYRLFTCDTAKIDLSGVNKKAVELAMKYIDAKIQIFAEGKKLKGKMINMEYSGSEIKMDLIFINNRRSKNYLVKNLIMNDLYKDQSNLVIFRYGDYEEGVKFTPEIQEYNFKVN
jgi:cellobiose-specific phosphotransferase system component IIA